MVGSLRRLSWWIVGAGWLGCGTPVASTWAQAPASAPPASSPGRLAPEAYALPGEDPPHGFVPAQPRSVADARRVESLRYYAEARAAEELRQYPEAIRLLEKALAADPEATAVLRRLSRINFALGREAEAIKYCQRVIAIDPGDVETVALLVDQNKDNPAAVEAFLKDALANPKLDKASTGALYLEFELGSVCEATGRFDQAAAAYAKVVDALDEKSNARLAPSELRRFLGADEAQAYLRFGRVFLQAKKYELAIRAFRRGLVYDPDEAILLFSLARAYQEAGRNEEALATVEAFLKRPPAGRDTYDLLGKILDGLGRGEEVIPRLEKAVAADPRNVPLRYALAERYKAAGQADKARAIYAEMLDDQRDTRGFIEAFPRLVKERKTEELLALLVRVTGRLRRLDPILDQVRELAADGPYADEVIDAGIKLLSANPPPFDPQDGWFVLVNLATEARRPAKLVDLLRWSLARTPNPIVFQELINTLADLERYAEAEAAIRELFDRFPNERTPRNLILLAQVQARAGKAGDAAATAEGVLRQRPNDPEVVRAAAVIFNQVGQPDRAIATLEAGLKLDPNDVDLAIVLGSLLGQVGRNDEAIRAFRGVIDRNPNDDAVLRVARSTLSTIYTNMGDFARGEAELEVLFAREPEDATVNNDLGYLYADQGKNLDRAETMIRKALNKEPDNSAFLDSLGWVLFKRGKVEEARTPLERAVSMTKSEDATVNDHLGDVYFQLHEVAKARSAWERAVKLASEAKPPDRRLPEIRKKLDALRQVEPSPRPARPGSP